MSKTICFFGATGGVANACLTAVLRSGEYKAIAMARTPEKLRDQLITLQGLEENVVNDRLTIVRGNAMDVTDVKNVLLANITANIDKSLPSMIVTSVGATPSLTFDVWHPWQIFKMDNATICESAATSLLSALKEIYAERPSLAAAKPAVTFVSTTGITRGPEDVPYAMRFLYHQILAVPHEDKKKMEDLLRNQMSETNPLLSSVTGIRPTLLMGTGALRESVGLDKVRAGVENAPELGFTVQRADVGSFIYEKVIAEGDARNWRSEMISLTA